MKCDHMPYASRLNFHYIVSHVYRVGQIVRQDIVHTYLAINIFFIGHEIQFSFFFYYFPKSLSALQIFSSPSRIFILGKRTTHLERITKFMAHNAV